MLHQENGGSSVLGEQRRGAKSKHERRKGSGSGTDQKDNNQRSKSFLERRSPVLASRKNETTKANDADAAVEAARQLSDTNFQLLLNELVACDKKPSEKSPLAKQLLDEVNCSDNNDNRINNNSSCTANNNSVNGTSDLLLSCEDFKSLSLNNNINNTSSNNSNNTSSSSSSSTTHQTSEGQNSERAGGGTGCDDFMRGMGSVTGRTMGASESRSDHRSPDDDDSSFSQPAPVILTGRVEESRNKMNSGENSKRKNRKDPKVRDSYPANSVPGYMGEESVETLMERIGEESQSNRRDREHGKGHMKVKNNIKTKDNAPVSSAHSPSSDGESTPSPPVTSPERTQRPRSPQSERGGSPLNPAERCEVQYLSDPDHHVDHVDHKEDWEEVTRKSHRKKKNAPAHQVAPEKREHKERHPPFHHNSHHHSHHQQPQQVQQQQPQQAGQQLQQTSSKDSAAIPAAPLAALTNSVTPAAAAMASKKASPPISRIASNTDDEFPPIGPPPSVQGAKPFVAEQKPKTVTTGTWGSSNRLADVLQGKKVPSPPQQQHVPQQQQTPPPQQQQQQQPPLVPQQSPPPPPAQQPQHPHQQSPPLHQEPPQQILQQQQAPIAKQEGPPKSKQTSPPVSIANRSGPGNVKSNRMAGGPNSQPGPILPPVAGGDYGDDFREEEGISFGNFDIETMRSIKASARIRVASRRDEEELKSCFNYRQCVKLLNDHWLEVHKTMQDPPVHTTRPIVAGGIRKQ